MTDENQKHRDNYNERMRQAVAIQNSFKDSPAWKPYTDGEVLYMATFDIFTNGRYKEPEVLRWSLYWARLPKTFKNPVSLYHDRTDGGRYYDTIEDAQEALNKRAQAHGWQVIQAPTADLPTRPDPETEQLELTL